MASDYRVTPSAVSRLRLFAESQVSAVAQRLADRGWMFRWHRGRRVATLLHSRIVRMMSAAAAIHSLEAEAAVPMQAERQAASQRRNSLGRNQRRNESSTQHEGTSQIRTDAIMRPWR